MNSIFRNPYHYCGTLIARVCVCAATILWSVIVLLRTDALLPTSYGCLLTGWVHEDVYGWALLLIAGMLLWRIFRQSPPHWVGIVGYGILMCSWLFVTAVLWLTRPMQPTSTAWVTVGAALAVFAFIANGRRGCTDAPRF